LGQAWPARTRRLARLAAITANPPDTARAAASTASNGTSQLGCPLGSGACVGAGIWAGVPLGMEKRSRASCRRRAASAAATPAQPRVAHHLLVRLRVDPDTRTYLARRTAQGKTRRDAKRCLRRVIARQLFRLLERYDQPGVEILWAA
jgi:hypothetical protein